MSTTYDILAYLNVVSDVSSVTIENFPLSYTDLVLVCNVHAVGSSSGAASLNITFNSDSNSLYSSARMQSNGSAASSSRSINQSFMTMGIVPATTSAGTVMGQTIVNIMSYSNTNINKTAFSTYATNAFNNTEDRIGRYAGLWRSTSAISRITLSVDSGNIRTSSNFTIYGIKAE